MEFRILGPLEVFDGERQLTLGSPRHRALLAALLVHSGEVVSTDQLIEALWGPKPPKSAPEMLHIRVSELRKLLRAGTSQRMERLVTRRPGYLMRVGADELDGHRFEQLALAGREALSNGDMSTAGTQLLAGLDLWRGPALIEISDRVIAKPAIARLDDLRLQAREDRFHAELALGRHLEAIGELEALVQMHPLRERFWCQLMLALYRAGRQGEALQAYQCASGHLVAELGIDPSAELRHLHMSILRQDATLQLRDPLIVSRGRTPNNLPSRLTSFVGRQVECAGVRALLEKVRLVTLTGVGGSGKSRLAMEVAAVSLDLYPDGVWIVELAVLCDPQLLVSTTASILGVHELPDRARVDLLVDHLRSAKVLLVLDNCEHLVDSVAELVGRLLDSSPGLRVLCTSRELLGIPGEVLRSVSGLGIPSPDRASPAQIRNADAVRLFVERAAAVQADFALSDASANEVADVCRRLDGLPLAIELAAARIGTFGAGQIAARLNDRFHLLVRGSRIALPRHQTLRAVIDWSYELLDESERRLFDHLSVFVGSFTFQAAEAICAPADTGALADLLGRLVDKSLVIADTVTTCEYRYRMLETLRAFGLEKLACRAQVDQVRARHARYFLALAERAGQGMRGEGQQESLARLVAEHTNLRAALEFSLTQGDVETAARLAGSLYMFWDLRGHYSEGRQWLNRVLASSGEISAAARTRALMGAATLAVIQGDLECAIKSCEQATVLSWQAGDSAHIAHALQYLGFIAIYTEELDRAAVLLHESLDIARTAGAAWEHAWALLFLTVLATTREEYESASKFNRQAEALLAVVGDQEALAWILLLRALGDWREGRTEQAAIDLRTSMQTFASLGGLWGLSVSLLVAALIATALRRFDACVRLLSAAEALRTSVGVALLPLTQRWFDSSRTEAHAVLGSEAFDREWHTGEEMSLDDALVEALSTLADADRRSQGGSTAHRTSQS